MAVKYVIAVLEINDDLLPQDRLHMDEIPDKLNQLTEELAPSGSLDLAKLFLLSAHQTFLLSNYLEELAEPFESPTVTLQPLAIVVNLNDRRPSAKSPDGSG